MTDSPIVPFHTASRSPAWARDHVLGCVLLGVSVIENEGHQRIASEIRHLIMLWYTGARRASPVGRSTMPEHLGELAPKARRRPRVLDLKDKAPFDARSIEAPEAEDAAEIAPGDLEGPPPGPDRREP